MLRSLSIAAAGTGVAAFLVIACTGTFEPTTGVFRTPDASLVETGWANPQPTAKRHHSAVLRRQPG